MTRILHADLRGYLLVANPDGSYRAGCRYFPDRAAALAHWGDTEYPNPERGAEYCAAIQLDQEINVLPAGLQWLDLYGNTLPAGTVLPERLQHICLSYGTLPEGLVLPARLRCLELHCSTLPTGIALPAGCKVIS